jgi:hypothetical protein
LYEVRNPVDIVVSQGYGRERRLRIDDDLTNKTLFKKEWAMDRLVFERGVKKLCH